MISDRDIDLVVSAYIEWRRLKGYPSAPKTAIDAMIDVAAGVGMVDEKLLEEFARFFREVIIERAISPEDLRDGAAAKG